MFVQNCNKHIHELFKMGEVEKRTKDASFWRVCTF